MEYFYGSILKFKFSGHCFCWIEKSNMNFLKKNPFVLHEKTNRNIYLYNNYK